MTVKFYTKAAKPSDDEIRATVFSTGKKNLPLVEAALPLLEKYPYERALYDAGPEHWLEWFNAEYDRVQALVEVKIYKESLQHRISGARRAGLEGLLKDTEAKLPQLRQLAEQARQVMESAYASKK
jgi:hypothetical protein